MAVQRETLRIELLETINGLSQQLQLFTDELKVEEKKVLPNEVFDEQGKKVSRSQAIDFFKQIDYHDGQDANTTVRHYGYLGISPSLVARVEQINQLKQRLAALFAAGKKVQVNSGDDTVDLVTAQLHAMGRARLQKQQATRFIQVTPTDTRTLSFFWANVRRVKKVPLEEIRARLVDCRDDLSPRLNTLADDAHLAEVSELPKQVRVNVGFIEEGQSRRCQRSCSLPILVPMASVKTTPLVIALDFKYKPRVALPRSDKKLESKAFITVNKTEYYRYLDTAAG